MKAHESRIQPIYRPRLAEAGDRVVRLYEAWGDPKKAAEWRARIKPSPPAPAPAPGPPTGTGQSGPGPTST
jgi:hypothetical protein